MGDEVIQAVGAQHQDQRPLEELGFCSGATCSTVRV